MNDRRQSLENLDGDRVFKDWHPGARRALEAWSRGELERRVPRRLESGMRVALIAPSSHLFEPDKYEQAREVIASLGFETTWGEDVRRTRGYMAGTVEARVEEIHRAFADKSVDALWCLRGGYGAQRLLPKLDYELVRAHPKPLIGYSDITALHCAFGKLAGLVSYHGPMPSRNLSPYSRAELERVLHHAESAGVIGAPPPFKAAPGQVDRQHRRVTIAPGVAEGPLVGGNLAMIVRLLGTPFEPDFDGRILFLEDVGEAHYRIDGMLHQLRLSGKLASLAGLVLGHFTEPGPMTGSPLPLQQIFEDHCANLGLPVLSGLACGHVDDVTTLPCGITARLDATAGTLELLEPAVS